MNETQARTVLLVKAFEEAGPEWLTKAECARASREAGAPEIRRAQESKSPEAQFTVDEERFLVSRAALLRGVLERKFSVVQTLRQVDWRSWFLPAAISVALLLGFAANALGPDKRISILAFPLLATLIWNLGIYLLLLGRTFLRRVLGTGAGRPETPVARWIGGWFRWRSPSGERPDDPLSSSARRFAASWLKWGAPLHAARARMLLHCAAAFFAIGLIGGMYLRGLAYEYLAGWESTFLNAHQVHLFLQVLLGPASALTGIAIPDADHIASLRWSAGQPGENAARWIHLYAATTALVVILPRMLLAAIAGLKARRLRHHLPFPAGQEVYFQRLLTPGRGEGTALSILPYSFSPEPREKETLRNLLATWLGWNSRIDFQSPVAYGAEDDYLNHVPPSQDGSSDYLALLFNMAATPEEENHGRFISGMKELSLRGKGPRHLVLILEESHYRRRMREESRLGARLAERRTSWLKLARDCGLEMLPLDLSAEPEISADQFRAAVWAAPQFDNVP
jgi:hypothetical protein